MKRSLKVRDDLRAFMCEVAALLEWRNDDTPIDGPKALVHACGRGGRTKAGGFRFVYRASNGPGRWSFMVEEEEIREIAAGVRNEIEAEQLVPDRGDPLLVWGDGDDDALRIGGTSDLAIALDGLYTMSLDCPLALRLWSEADDQVFAVIAGDHCALYVVTSSHGYGTSVGDPSRRGTFDVASHAAGTVTVPWCHCVPWLSARAALIAFADSGTFDGLLVDPVVAGHLVWLGDWDRATELARRGPPPADLAGTSIGRRVRARRSRSQYGS